jgi:hypothetical protein
MKPVKKMVQFVLDRFTEKPFDIKAFGEIRADMSPPLSNSPLDCLPK